MPPEQGDASRQVDASRHPCFGLAVSVMMQAELALESGLPPPHWGVSSAHASPLQRWFPVLRGDVWEKKCSAHAEHVREQLRAQQEENGDSGPDVVEEVAGRTPFYADIVLEAIHPLNLPERARDWSSAWEDRWATSEAAEDRFFAPAAPPEVTLLNERQWAAVSSMLEAEISWVEWATSTITSDTDAGVEQADAEAYAIANVWPKFMRAAIELHEVQALAREVESGLRAENGNAEEATGRQTEKNLHGARVIASRTPWLEALHRAFEVGEKISSMFGGVETKEVGDGGEASDRSASFWERQERVAQRWEAAFHGLEKGSSQTRDFQRHHAFYTPAFAALSNALIVAPRCEKGYYRAAERVNPELAAFAFAIGSYPSLGKRAKRRWAARRLGLAGSSLNVFASAGSASGGTGAAAKMFLWGAVEVVVTTLDYWSALAELERNSATAGVGGVDIEEVQYDYRGPTASSTSASAAENEKPSAITSTVAKKVLYPPVLPFLEYTRNCRPLEYKAALVGFQALLLSSEKHQGQPQEPRQEEEFFNALSTMQNVRHIIEIGGGPLAAFSFFVRRIAVEFLLWFFQLLRQEAASMLMEPDLHSGRVVRDLVQEMEANSELPLHLHTDTLFGCLRLLALREMQASMAEGAQPQAAALAVKDSAATVLGRLLASLGGAWSGENRASGQEISSSARREDVLEQESGTATGTAASPNTYTVFDLDFVSRQQDYVVRNAHILHGVADVAHKLAFQTSLLEEADGAGQQPDSRGAVGELLAGAVEDWLTQGDRVFGVATDPKVEAGWRATSTRDHGRDADPWLAVDLVARSDRDRWLAEAEKRSARSRESASQDLALCIATHSLSEMDTAEFEWYLQKLLRKFCGFLIYWRSAVQRWPHQDWKLRRLEEIFET
eukprot:g13588.t1